MNEALDSTPDRARPGSSRGQLTRTTREDPGRRIEHLERRVTQLEHAVEQLHRQARLDPLTQVANRRALDEYLAAWDDSDRGQGPLCVFVADLDGLKQTNDSLGHAAGDRALMLVADCMTKMTGPEDLVARIGGDEFVVVLVGKSLEQARELAEQVATQMASTQFPDVGVSIGIAQRRVGEPAAALLARADRALYRARQARRAWCADEDEPA
jgi:diguanylate cyclase (GGDEF)-like protein